MRARPSGTSIARAIIPITTTARCSLINLPIAIVIHAVAGLRSAWANGRTAIVTVATIGHISIGSSTGLGGNLSIPISIPIGILIEGGLPSFVDLAITVVIRPVTDFGRAGMYGRIAIVTIGVIGDIRSRRCACVSTDRGIAEAIAIGILIESGYGPLIDLTIAVII
jgi:hypothetical protein